MDRGSRSIACGTMYLLLLAECILILNAQDINLDFSTREIQNSDTKGGIQTLITPPNSTEPRPEFAKAEVRLLVPSAPVATNFQPEWVIRASSILMDYDEEDFRDISRRVAETTNKPRPNHIRHQHHRRLSPGHSNERGSSIREAQLDEPVPSEPATRESEEHRPIDRVPVRALYYKENQLPSLKQVPGNKIRKKKLKSIGNDTWIALHSPVRIFIPVRYDDGLKQSEANCVHCSSNITITIPRGETKVAVPAPAITICSRLAHARGRLNIAVVNGPQPGNQASEGDYQTRLLLWKNGGNIYSCTYKLTVAVKKCEKIFPPHGGSIDCSNENFWGSKCKFSCSPGFILQGNSIVICGDNSAEVLWSSPFPTCKPSESIPPLKRLPCFKPPQPKDGTVICDSDHKDDYPDGSVCQFFCFPGFLIENILTSSSLAVCKNGKWTPNGKISCLATYCSEPPSPLHGSVICDHQNVKDSSIKSKYENGTTCALQCDYGYTIPKSSLSRNQIMCNAPFWNDSTIPECKQKVEPYPHPKDCRNQTVMANRRGFFKLKPARFYIRKDSFSTKTVYGNCSLPGKVSVGSYINYCTSRDVELNTTGYCSYSVTVKENGCSHPPTVSHASIECDSGIKESYPRSTICKYVCDEGYIIPLKERKFQHKVCRPRLKWRPSGQLTCKRAIAPKPKKKSCISEIVYLEGTNKTTLIKPPRFRPSVKGSKVKVQCSLEKPLSVGNYTNVCDAFDTFLGLNSSCEYSVTILDQGCPVLPDLPDGFINCSTIAYNGYHPVGTVCNYGCADGNVVPTSFLLYSHKKCIDQGWNLTLSPVCVTQIQPVADSDSCLNRSIATENIADVQISPPEFTSSSGAKLTSTCHPQNISTFGEYVINCSAYDPQLRVAGSCSFYLDVRNSNNIAEQTRKVEEPILISGCDNYSKVGLHPIHLPDPVFHTSKNKLASVICMPEVIEGYGSHEITCTATDNELGTKSSCSFIFNMIPMESTSVYPSTTNDPTTTTIDNNLKLTTTTSPQTVTKVTSIDETTVSDTETTPSLNTNQTTTVISTYETSQDILFDSTADSTTSQSTTAHSVISETSTPVFASTIPSVKACQLLEPPNKGYITCSTAQNCTVGCKQGHNYPPDFEILEKGWIECDSTDGLWDFQKPFKGLISLPSCLGELPNTFIKVWMGFSLSVENCSEEKQSVLYSFMDQFISSKYEDSCEKIDCKTFEVHCSDAIKDVIHVNWTLKALFDPLEFANTKNVLPLEVDMEKILTSIHSTVKDDSKFEGDLLGIGFELNKTFSRGYFRLFCEKEGYSVNEDTNICVECPPGTKEEKGLCIRCPSGTYQLESGQVLCKSCPPVFDPAVFLNQKIPEACFDKEPSKPSLPMGLTAS